MGCVCYEMLHGEPPHFHQDEMQQLEAIKKGNTPWPKKSFGKLSSAGTDFIKKLLVADPKKRMAIDDVLQHAWLQPVQDKALVVQMETKADDQEEIAERRAERRRKAARRRLRSAVDVVVAGQRISRLLEGARASAAEEAAPAAEKPTGGAPAGADGEKPQWYSPKAWFAPEAAKVEKAEEDDSFSFGGGRPPPELERVHSFASVALIKDHLPGGGSKADDEEESEDEEVEEGYDQMRAFNTTFNALGLNNSLVPSSPEKEKEVRA